MIGIRAAILCCPEQFGNRPVIPVMGSCRIGLDRIGCDEMKPLPAPNVPGNTDAERFDNAVRKMFTVSKYDVLKAEAKWRRSRARKKQAKKTA